MLSSARRHLIPAVLAVVAITIGGCSTLKNVADALTSLGKLQFKLGNVSDFTLGSINISNLSSASDINPLETVNLVNAVRQGKLPVAFTVNVQAKNPNDASGSKPTPLFLRKISWTLSIDDRKTITGVTDRRLEIPASGQVTTIPITMSLDLMQFFADKGYADIVNLAFAIGGKSGSSSRLKMTARVTVENPVTQQPFEYPGDITIVNSQFSNP